MTLVDAALRSVIKHEGGFTNHREDRGNWTSGVVGDGELRGTKFGISAMTYPDLDIANLTVDDAMVIYRRDFVPLVPERLEPAAWWFALDTAVNSGPARMRAFVNQTESLPGLVAARLEFLASLSTWPTFGRGWVRRVAGVLADIETWRAESDPPESASTLVLHNLRPADRWAALATGPVALRGSFAWRYRAENGGRLDVRRE